MIDRSGMRVVAAIAAVLVVLPGAGARASSLAPGDEGPAVVLWQKTLNLTLRAAGPAAPEPLTEDGVFGPLTAAATRWLERDSGIPSDGVAGPRDRRMALSGFLTCCGARRPAVARGAWGPLVGQLQLELNEWLRAREPGVPRLVVDLQLGPLTQAAVELFQEAHGLDADGIVGPRTWGALFGGASG